MVLNKNKISKKYENANLFKNDGYIKVGRMYDARKLLYTNHKRNSTINWAKYQIKETDMRAKTATFTSDVNLDLTTGLFTTLIGSNVHENFGGVILKKDYNEDTGLYDYQCQDYSRFYQSKFELIANNTKLHRLLKFLITRGGISTYGKINDSTAKAYKNVLSGLRPAYLYDPALWGNDKTSNPMNVPRTLIIRNKTYMEAIRDLVYSTGAYIDVYFTDNGVLQIKPFNKEDWLSGGLVLTTPEIAERKFTFDTTNIITGVVINGNNKDGGRGYGALELTGLSLTAFFGNLIASEDNPNKDEIKVNNVKTVKKSVKTTKKEGTGIDVFINTDNIHSKSADRKMLNDIAKLLRKRGYSVTVGGVGSMTHYNDINKVKKNGIYFTMYGGRCAGTLKEQCYSGHYHNVLKKKNARMVVGFLGKKLTDAYLPRAYDDNFSGGGFRGWDKPRTRLLNAGIGIAQGMTVKEVASSFPGFKKNNPKASTKTKTTTKKVKTKVSNAQKLMMENKNRNLAMEKIQESIRDLLKLKISLPLGNPILKNLHTNMFLWTVLPEEFGLANFQDIGDVLNSAYARYSGYELNRWYVEEVTITNNGTDGTVDIGVNPFASTIAKYRDNRLKYESDYTNAVKNAQQQNTNTNKTTNKKTTVKKTKKVNIKDALDEVGKLAEKKTYSHAYQSYSGIKKYGKGDCWAMSNFIACELEKRGVKTKILQYPTSQSSRHRSVQYRNSKGQWVNFPYRSYKIHNWFRDTAGVKHGTVIKRNCS